MTTSEELDRREAEDFREHYEQETARMVAELIEGERRAAWGEIMALRLDGQHKAAALRLLSWLWKTSWDNPAGDEYHRIITAGLLQGDVVR